jgi:quinol monooxygenase YgiN
MALALVVKFTVAEGNQDKAAEMMRIMEQHTRREAGCRLYIAHQSTEDPRTFLFYELYENEAALEAHKAAPYFKQYVADGLMNMMITREFLTYSPLS